MSITFLPIDAIPQVCCNCSLPYAVLEDENHDKYCSYECFLKKRKIVDETNTIMERCRTKDS
jgi:hypothetical protein